MSWRLWRVRLWTRSKLKLRNWEEWTMKICVLYDSVTGNTKQLAEVIERKYEALLVGNPAEADVVFLGSWTDKGSFSEKMKEQAEKIRGKRSSFLEPAALAEVRSIMRGSLNGRLRCWMKAIRSSAIITAKEGCPWR